MATADERLHTRFFWGGFPGQRDRLSPRKFCPQLPKKVAIFFGVATTSSISWSIIRNRYAKAKGVSKNNEPQLTAVTAILDPR